MYEGRSHATHPHDVSIDDIVERCFLSEHLSEQVPSVILTAVPGPIIGGLALAGFGTSLALQVPIVDY